MTHSRRFFVLPLMMLGACPEECDNPPSAPIVCTAVRAVINGNVYDGCQDNAFNTGGSLNVASSSGTGANYMELNFGADAAVGTTTIGSGVSTTFQVDTPVGIWVAGPSAGSGSLTIATLTATGATGTFFFTAPPAGGATGNTVATGGTFNVTF